MAINPANIKKRESNLIEKLFPFEVIHIDEPANNMNMFHWHEYMEISYIQKGKGTYEIEDKTLSVEKGDIVIINNIERHRVTYKPEDLLYETVFHFEPGLIWSKENSPFDYNYLKLFFYKGNFNNKPELNSEIKKVITSLISEIVTEYQKKEPYYELMIKSKLLTVITYLIRQCNLKTVSDYDVIVKRNTIDRLQRILEYINENFDQNITMDSCAKKFFMNPSYFSDYFKKNIGINFLEYLAKVRVAEAIRLLNENKANSTEVAFICGFNNTVSFYNAFKKITGVNPSDFKKSKPDFQ